ncbi:AAA domain-containing protein [Kitasatospora sp. MAP5-34]|uniref:caspase, EACC1-associated type n=1 Tax=Kitasatospora sp. MAP5-34 TaxID=3035102 RepID=UPI0024743266|nr:AAA domain-containing protein [Kitasatospora sp. MAP5-34]MDH6579189.1 hypothetical protein [Kitasatospora sp. MAP5-34]
MRRALLIGTTRYTDPGLHDLPGAREDVRLLQGLLEDPLVGAFEVQVLLDATKEQIESALETLIQGTRRGDTVLIHLSGHGFKSLGGELYFAVRQTRRETPVSTAVSAQDLRSFLRSSKAGSKMVLLDCCYSGAVADGFAGRSSADSLDLPAHFKDSQGTHILAAAGPTQQALEPAPQAGIAQPSVFTKAVVDGLRNAVDSDLDGWISSSDLADHVEQALAEEAQRPTNFELTRQGAIRIAQKARRGGPPAGPANGPANARAQQPEQARRRSAGSPAQSVATAAGEPDDPADAPFDAVRWQRLLHYYRDCLLREGALSEILPLKSADRFALVPGGPEEVLSGAAGRLAVRGELTGIVARGVAAGQQLRYGYPVVLSGPKGRKQSRDSDWGLAPLLTVDLEMRQDGAGEPELVPVGDFTLNLGALQAVTGVSAGELEEIEAWFSMQWPQGDHAALTSQIANLLTITDLPARHAVDAAALRPDLELTPRQEGAQNAAVLYLADPGSSASSGLLEDFDKELIDQPARLATTALSGLGGPDDARKGDPRPWQLVSAGKPLNQGQEAVLQSAMSRRLTVATGPPGTGKSELVAAVVTTAVAAGQTVLVASTNNQAVDVVATRVGELVPGSIIRTGAQRYREQEPELLGKLLMQTAQPGLSPATAAHGLRLVEQRVDRARAALAARARAEGRRYEAWLALRDHAAVLGWDLDSLPAQLSDPGWLGRWRRAAERAAGSGVRANWNQRKVRRELGIDLDEERLSALAKLLAAEERRLEAAAEPAAAVLLDLQAGELLDLQEERRLAGGDLVRAVVADALVQGRPAIERRIVRLQVNARRSWDGFAEMLPYVRAWAVSSLSARRLPPRAALFDLVVIDEASQCSIPAVLPLLLRAKRALIIGDPQQLRHIATIEAERADGLRRASGLSAEWISERRLDFREHSAFDAFAEAAGEVLLLDEHYRCHPDIAGVVNERFYRRQLQVLTDPSRLACRMDPAVRWADTPGSRAEPSGSSWVNHAEAAALPRVLRHAAGLLPADGKIGVVTPFAPQRALLERSVPQELRDRVTVGTIHTFQGDEKDLMVFSLVAAPGIQQGSLNWLLSQASLWNVAITRAKSVLVVLGDRDYWAQQTGPVKDLLRVAASAGPAAHAASPDLATPSAANTSADLLHQAFRARRLDFERDARIGGYRCDFMVRTALGTVAVVIDEPELSRSAQERARAMLLLRQRCVLLEKSGADRALLVPAWRCVEQPEAVAQEVGGR